MKIVTLVVAIIASVVLLVSMGTPGNAKVKFGIYIGPNIDAYQYHRHRDCHWETRRGDCYQERVCTWRSRKSGRCKQYEWKTVCDTQRVKVCY